MGMSCLEGLESTAPAGRVQVSQACKDSVEGLRRKTGPPGSFPADFDFDSVTFEEVKGDLLTSKGEVVPQEDVGGAPTYVISCAPDKSVANSGSITSFPLVAPAGSIT